MPNTLAHLGLHAITTKAVFPRADIKWIYLGAVLPDIPFVIKRAVSLVASDVDILDVRLFALTQASLLFTLILAFACSRFSNKSKRVFLVLGFGVLLHLLIDACQIKWGNGPRFLVPFDWTLTSFGFFWPEQLPSHLLTALGALYVIYAFTLPIRAQARDLIFPRQGPLFAACVSLAVYSFLPLAFLGAAEQVGAGNVQMIRSDARGGQEVELDRARYRHADGQMIIEIYRGEFVSITGIDEALQAEGKMSVRGMFLTHEVIQANEYHLNDSRYREQASMVGLAVVTVYWLIIVVARFRRKE